MKNTTRTKIIGLLTRDSDLMTEIHSAQTLDEIKKVYEKTPRGSEVEKAALLKWVELAQTFDEIKKAYDMTPRGSEAREACIKKAEQFLPAETT